MAEKFSALSHALPQAPTRRHTARSGGKMARTDDQPRISVIGVAANACERVGIGHLIQSHPAPLAAVACSQCPVLGKAARTFGKRQMRESLRNLRISGANFMGASLRKHSSAVFAGKTRCDLLPRKEAGCQHAKARRVSSSRSLAARVSWAEPCSHRAAILLFGLLFRKTAGGSKERQIAKTAISSDLGLFSAAEASMKFLAELVDRWFRSGIVHLDVKTREGFMWRGR